MMRLNEITGVRRWDEFDEFKEAVKDAAEGRIAPLTVFEMAIANRNWGVTFSMENGKTVIDEESLHTEEHARKLKEWDDSLNSIMDELSGENKTV